MNYLLVGVTFVVIAIVFIGVALLATDRLVPARKPILFLARDGVDLAEDRDMPIILPENADPKDYKAVKLVTSLAGYNKQETDDLLKRLVAENENLRSQLRRDSVA